MSNQVILPQRGSKYKNIKCQVDGRMFDSKGEMNRYVTLKIAQQGGIIQGLRCQVPYKITINGALVCTYIADFVYTHDGKEVIEDFKGLMTDVFQLKRKLMRAVHGIEILITRKPTAFSDIGERKKVVKKKK